MPIINVITNIFHFSDNEDGEDTWSPQEANWRRGHGKLGLARHQVKQG